MSSADRHLELARVNSARPQRSLDGQWWLRFGRLMLGRPIADTNNESRLELALAGSISISLEWSSGKCAKAANPAMRLTVNCELGQEPNQARSGNVLKQADFWSWRQWSRVYKTKSGPIRCAKGDFGRAARFGQSPLGRLPDRLNLFDGRRFIQRTALCGGWLGIAFRGAKRISEAEIRLPEGEE